MSASTRARIHPLSLAFGFGLAAAIGALLYFANRTTLDEAARMRAEHEEVVRAEAAPVQAAMQAAAAATEPYDIEATMRVVRELDLAIERAGSPRDYFQALARTDYRRVAPQMLAARKRILDVLVKYFGALEKQQHEDQLWQSFGRWSDELAKLLQASNLSVGALSLSPTNPDVQRVLVEERKRREESRTATFHELVRFEEELLLALDATLPVFREAEDEWARLCAQRDRAYLQCFELDFAQAAVSAEAALAMAPFDEESMLLLALARIEGGEAVRVSESAPSTERLLDTVLKDNPDCAPALLLRGLASLRAGRTSEGRTDLELAATRYPEQAERLRDVLDPYRSRDYLRKTRQGGRITGLYRAMMLGANWFSPELQTARAQIALGDKDGALRHVRDHFARRRAQGQWDLVLYDLAFCEDLLGELYSDVFPEKSYLDLRVEESTFGDDIEVLVDNRSDKALHNAALVLAVRFTDMVEEEYEPFTAGATQPVLPPNQATSFGQLSVEYDGLGPRKAFADVVPPIRAVLVADEGVFWIDSIQTKSERLSRHAPLGQKPAAPSGLSERLEGVLDSLGAGDVAVSRVAKLLTADDLAIELPRELMLLGPLFKLEAGDAVFDEARGEGVVHRLTGGKLRLTFERGGKVLDGASEKLRLVAKSALGDIAIVLERNANGNYVFGGLERP